MHDTAYQIAGKFFELYWHPGNELIIELGSYNVNGSLRDHQPPGSKYIGVDMEAGPSVDTVIENSSRLPFADAEADCVVSSSTFEHDKFFWQSFLEMCRITKPGGYIYFNAPSNGMFHRYPFDYWRFYPDAGRGLEAWAVASGIQVTLVESFVAGRIGDYWNDFVAVFQRGEPHPRSDDAFIHCHFACQNVYRFDRKELAALEPLSQDMQLLFEAQAAAKQMPELNRQISDFAEQISNLNQVAALYAPLNAAHLAMQHEHDIVLQGLGARINELELLKVGLEQSLAESDTKIRVLNNAAQENEGRIQTLELQVTNQNDSNLAMRHEHDIVLQGLGARINELELLKVGLEQSLAESDTKIRVLNNAAQEDERHIRTLELQVKSLNDSIHAKEKHIITLDQAIAGNYMLIENLRCSILERDLQIAQLTEKLGRIYRSLSWRLMTPWRKIGSWFQARP